MTAQMQSPRDAFTIVQLVLIDESGDSYYRMRWPGATLAKQRPGWRIVNLDSRAKERYDYAASADLLVLYQSVDLDMLPVIADRRRRGLKTLVEYNDNFYAPQAWSPVAKAWSSPLVWQIYEHLMDAADAVLCTGPGLHEVFAQRLPPSRIHILENQLPFVPAPRPEPTANELLGGPRTLRLGWAGSLGHMADLLSVVPLLRELVQELPELRIHLMGNQAIPGLVNLPKERLRFTGWGSMHEYYEFWRSVDLGIAPLIDTPYNRCRSDIKAVEMAGLGVAPLLPQALPYEVFLRETGLTPVLNHRELGDRVRVYARNRPQLSADATTAQDYVARHRVDLSRTERVRLYESMLPQEPACTLQMDASQSRASLHTLPTGYQERSGVAEAQLPSAKKLEEASERLQRGDKEAALRLVECLAAENPRHADVRLSLLRLRAQLSPIEQHLATAIADFPRDFRFLLLRIQLCRVVIDREAAWALLLAALQAAPLAAQRFFRAEVVRLLIADLERIPTLLPLAERAAGLYQTTVALRMALAEQHARAGDEARALAHFQWLTTALDTLEINRDGYDPLHFGYASSFREGLQEYLDKR
jgi:hypothetical protein